MQPWRLECGRPFSEYLAWSKRDKQALESRYVVFRLPDNEVYVVRDRYLNVSFELSACLVQDSRFDIAMWFRWQLRRWLIVVHDPNFDYSGLWCLFGYENPEGKSEENKDQIPDLVDYSDSRDDKFEDSDSDEWDEFNIFSGYDNGDVKEHKVVEMGDWSIFENHNKWDLPASAGMAVAQTDNDTLPLVMRTAAVTKDPSRVVPNYITVVVHVNGEPAQVLIDTGSLCDFMLLLFANQLKVKKEELATPLTVQLAALGSRTKVNYRATVDFKYQGINESCSFEL
jgi:hypothetical protein